MEKKYRLRHGITSVDQENTHILHYVEFTYKYFKLKMLIK